MFGLFDKNKTIKDDTFGVLKWEDKGRSWAGVVQVNTNHKVRIRVTMQNKDHLVENIDELKKRFNLVLGNQNNLIRDSLISITQNIPELVEVKNIPTESFAILSISFNITERGIFTEVDFKELDSDLLGGHLIHLELDEEGKIVGDAGLEG